MGLFRWLSHYWQQIRREANIPAPPFRASKRTAVIMYGLWYGRLTKEEARKQATEWDFPLDAIEEMIVEATQPPSYWSQHGCPHNVVLVDYLHPYSDIEGVKVLNLKASDPTKSRPIMTLKNPRCAVCAKPLSQRLLGARIRTGGDLYDARFRWC